ncbi:hypothetical protein D3C71_1598570 [compost metagenome]
MNIIVRQRCSRNVWFMVTPALAEHPLREFFRLELLGNFAAILQHVIKFLNHCQFMLAVFLFGQRYPHIRRPDRWSTERLRYPRLGFARIPGRLKSVCRETLRAQNVVNAVVNQVSQQVDQIRITMLACGRKKPALHRVFRVRRGIHERRGGNHVFPYSNEQDARPVLWDAVVLGKHELPSHFVASD